MTTPRAELIKLAYQLQAEVDIIVCLSHLGITEDELLAQECPQIDAIFGAHTHHVFENGRIENGVILTGGGKFGQYTGQLTLEFDHTTKKLVEKTDRLYENALLPEIEEEEKWLASLQKEAKAILEIPEFRQIEEKIETKKEEYQSVLSRLKTVDFSNMFSAESLSILDKASLGKPLTSVRMKGLGMGLLLGLALGFFVIYLINIFDDTFGTISELTGQVSETILGQIPEIKSAKGESIFSLMVGGDSASHGLVESFRNLRSSIMFANPAGQTPKVIGVTSSVPSEGKSTVAANLAISLAKSGKKVLLMDGDVRRGRVLAFFGIRGAADTEKENASDSHKYYKGLVEFLYQEVSVDDIILKSPVAGLETLDIIPAGKLQRSPGEIFLSPALGVLFNELRQRYDFIIVDTAPMLATDDTSNLAQKVDTCIFVVRGDFTSMRFVRESLKRLRSRCINVLGLVFNRGHVATKDRYYYYYEYDEYYGMGEDGKRVKKRKRRSHY